MVDREMMLDILGGEPPSLRKSLESCGYPDPEQIGFLQLNDAGEVDKNGAIYTFRFGLEGAVHYRRPERHVRARMTFPFQVTDTFAVRKVDAYLQLTDRLDDVGFVRQEWENRENVGALTQWYGLLVQSQEQLNVAVREIWTTYNLLRKNLKG